MPRSISPATAPAARPTAQTTHSVSTTGCSMPIARKSLGRSKFRSPQPSAACDTLPGPLKSTSSKSF